MSASRSRVRSRTRARGSRLRPGRARRSSGQPGRSAALPLVADVRDRGAVESAVALAEEELGPLDVLVNNAGTLAAIGPLAEVDPADWWLDVETSLRGTLLCTHAVLPGMLERGRGRIVNVSSYAGTRPGPYHERLLGGQGCAAAT